MTSPRRIAIVGAGPAGTALALGLVRHGYEVTLVSERTAEEIRAGSVMSSQITFESALEAEAALGISDLLPSAPPIERMSYSTSRLDGSTAEFTVDLPSPARSSTSGSGSRC
jgi:2-polyprenyl-6-methoxyphenol hydroxylase-like FAD-dependent oxidoreductase